MKTLLFALLLSASAGAQSLTFYIDASDGATPAGQLPALPSAYAFPDTVVGQQATINVRAVNTSARTVQLNALYVGMSSGSPSADSNFTITGLSNATFAPGDFKLFSLNFGPATAGAAVGYLQASLLGQAPVAISTLSGNGLTSSVNLTCTDALLALCDGKTPLLANGTLLFGDPAGLSLGANHSILFTLTNDTLIPISRPTISSTNFALVAFTSPDLAAVPDTVPSGVSVNFTIVFTPQAVASGPSTAQSATLTVGSAFFTLQGRVLIVQNNDPLQVTCVYSTGKPCQGAGNILSVGPDLTTLATVFQVTNPNPLGTAFAAITLAAPPAISDPTDFTLSAISLGPTGSTSGASTVPAGQPVTIPPGYSLSFQVNFGATKAATTTLTIGNGLTYTLNAQPTPVVNTPQSDLQGLTLMCGTSACSSQTFSSQQQVQATLQVSTATTAGATLAISFKPLTSGITDPAVTFISPVTQTNLNFAFRPTSLSGLLSNGQPQFTFQTGTTAGTINFLLTDSATQLTTTLSSITIAPAKVQITSTTAVRQSPNLILTITGYDNTYSVGPLSFTFTDITGKSLTPSAIQVNATSTFQQYFLAPANQAGGAFSLQVTFPTSGDVTQIGAVTANLTNSAGQSSVTQTFQ